MILHILDIGVMLVIWKSLEALIFYFVNQTSLSKTISTIVSWVLGLLLTLGIDFLIPSISSFFSRMGT